MSMFQVSGVVLHVYDAPAMTDKKTGEVTREEKPKVQLLGDIPLPNGQARFDMITLTCEDRAEFEELKGRKVTVPLGMFAPAKEQIIYFIPKGAHPAIVEGQGATP